MKRNIRIPPVKEHLVKWVRHNPRKQLTSFTGCHLCVLLFLLVFTLIFSDLAISQEIVEIGRFSQSDIKDWQVKRFKGETVYTIVSLEGKQVLKAESDKSAAAFYKEIEIDLTKTPYLNWSWRVENILSNLNEQSKNGDDFPARVYVVVKSGFLSLSIKALNYVWSSVTPIGQSWDNPFIGSVKMLSLRSGNTHRGTWQKEKRNVREDLINFLGSEYLVIYGVAVMTDTDNSKGKVRAYYGDIYFSKH